MLNGHFKAGGPRYEYLPFELSAGTESVTISYSYTGDDGSSVIDLGLFEPGPLTLGTPAFRGYSGGAQRTITVGRNHASPGLQDRTAARRHVARDAGHVQGRARRRRRRGPDQRGESEDRAARDWRLRRAEEAPCAADSTRRSRQWYSGALHLHTTHSDGTLTPRARSPTPPAPPASTSSSSPITTTRRTRREPMPASPLHIVGEEVTTPGGHANVWGLPEGAWIDFRVSPTDPGAADAINGFVAAAHQAGALVRDQPSVRQLRRAAPGSRPFRTIWTAWRSGTNEKGPQRRRRSRSGIACCAPDAASRRSAPATGIGCRRRSASAAVRVFATALTEPAILDGIRQRST